MTAPESSQQRGTTLSGNRRVATLSTLQVPLWFVAAFLFFYVLAIGKALLIPLVLAIFIWYLINGLARFFDGIRIRGKNLPTAVEYLVAGLVILAAGAFLVLVTIESVAEVQSKAGGYQANFEQQANRIIQWAAVRFHLEEAPDVRDLLGQVSFASVVGPLANALGELARNTGVVLVYLLFIFLEQAVFPRKIAALFRRPEQREDVGAMLDKIGHDVRKYVGIKALASLMVAAGGYLVMVAVGVDLAEFWALLLFLFNFIPYIGSIAATLFPTLLAAVQFPTLMPAIIIVSGITAIQVTVGNLIEPMIAGRSLNLSPLIIILSLAVWGTLWGLAGAILSVPLTMVALIVCSRFEATRPIAVLLSQDGQVRPVGRKTP